MDGGCVRRAGEDIAEARGPNYVSMRMKARYTPLRVRFLVFGALAFMALSFATLAFQMATVRQSAVANRRSQIMGEAQLVKLYILAYLAYRFGSEFLRPEPHWLGGLTVYQWTALALAPIFIVLWLRDASSPCSERRRSTSESRHST